MPHVLIVDDESSICWGVRELLTDEGYEVSIAPSAEVALRMTETLHPDAVLMDVRLPGMDGLTALSALRKQVGDVPVVVMTAFGTLETAVRALEEGAFDYLAKPFDLDTAADVVGRALASRRTGQPADEINLASPPHRGSTLIGLSLPMQRLFKQIALAATSDVSVLITGESGTGKELVARAIHQNSSRRDAHFLPVCIPALSPALIESELFGHVRGAFTGSTDDRKGLLEMARGGTVLLDEAAEIDLSIQVKLLRALENREIIPVGEARPRAIDVRIIAATNRPLAEQVRLGEFREDLFYRLSVFHIHVPPLRERPDDIPALAEYFLQSGQTGNGPRGPAILANATLRELMSRSWRGNVRELRNVLDYARIFARGGTVQPEHLPPPQEPVGEAEKSTDDVVRRWVDRQFATLSRDMDGNELHSQFLRDFESSLLRAVLAQCGDNRTTAAKILGLHRTTLRQKLRDYGAEPEM